MSIFKSRIIRNKGFEIYLLVNVFLINIVGLITIYSTSIEKGGLALSNHISRQLLIVLLALLIYYIVSKIDYTYLKQKPILIIMMTVNLVFLTSVLLLGVERNGAKRWLDLGVFDLQPSEFGKFFLIIIGANLLQAKEDLSAYKRLFVFIMYTILCLGLVFIEPDAGMTLIISIIVIVTIVFGFRNRFKVVGMLGIFCAAYLGGLFIITRNPYILYFSIAMLVVSAIWYVINKHAKSVRIVKLDAFISVVIVLLALVFGLFSRQVYNDVFESYMRERVDDFIALVRSDQENYDPNIVQSMVAIGSGEIIGKGFGHGTQSKLQFLPEHRTDFIFATFSEEFGFIGSVILLLLFLILFLQLFYIASTLEDKFASIIVFAYGFKLLIETLVNMGMNLAVSPATGVPLPFVSAGGSHMIVNYIGLGVVVSILKVNNEKVIVN